MTIERPYRRAMEPAAAMAELRRCAGTQFDADVVEAFGLVLLDRAHAGGRNGLTRMARA
jgi:HD-GYP domain-containing protein (c-di-GMP phosphodiesterase class II)